MRFDETSPLDAEAVRLGYVESTTDWVPLVALYLARIYDLAQVVERTGQEDFLDLCKTLAELRYGIPPDGS